VFGLLVVEVLQMAVDILLAPAVTKPKSIYSEDMG
jgi:hypothetical protein